MTNDLLALLANDCELYAKVIEGIIVVDNDWQPGDPERREPRETLLKAAAVLRAAPPAEEEVRRLIEELRAWPFNSGNALSAAQSFDLTKRAVNALCALSEEVRQATIDEVAINRRACQFAISWGASGTLGGMIAEFAIRELRALSPSSNGKPATENEG